MKRYARFAVIAAVSTLMCGCSSTKVFHSAFDDITQDTRSTVGDFSTYRQLITLNGLMPMHVPGMLFYEPTASWLPQWLQSESPALLVGISPKRSMVVEARYDADKPEEAVAGAQKAYQSVRAKAVAAVAARLRVAMLEALAQAKDEDQIRALAQHLNFKDDKPAAADVAAAKKIALDEAAKASKELEDAQAGFSAALGHNIMVARWTKKEDFQGVAKLFNLVGLGSGRQFEESGVLILAGIRVLNTFFGEDLSCMARYARANPARWDHMKRAGITVNMIQARAVGYVSDLDVEHTLALSLDVSKEQLEDLIKGGVLQAAGVGTSINAQALVASAMGVSNFGRMVKPAIDQRKTRFYPAARQVEELEEELENSHGRYVTVSVTRAQFTASMLDSLAEAATDAICNEELEPQRSLTETVARTRRRIEISAAAAANALTHGKEELPQAALVRRGLTQKLQAASAALDACAPRIAEIDQDVASALAAVMNASEEEREARRYSVRIRNLQREQDGAEIMAFLNAISDDVYKAQNGVREAEAIRSEGRDPSPQMQSVVLALGVKAEPKITETTVLADRPDPTLDVVQVAGAPATLGRIDPPPVRATSPDPKVVEGCKATRASRRF